MKFVIFALVASTSAVSAAPCPLTDMALYATSQDVTTCESSTGASLSAIATTGQFPDDKTLKTICTNSVCQSAVKGLSKFAPCDLPNGSPLNGLISDFATKCSPLGGATTNSSASTTTGAMTAASNTTLIAGATKKPATNSTTSPSKKSTTDDVSSGDSGSEMGSSSGMDSEVKSGKGSDVGSTNDAHDQDQTVQSVVPTPHPKKKSSASMLATASGAVIAVVVATLL